MKRAIGVVLLLLLASVPFVAPALSNPGQTTGNTRTEQDLLGEKQIPADAFYGVQTARALENFQISGIPMGHYPEFVDAFAIVKLAAARANTKARRDETRTAGGDREGLPAGPRRAVPRSVYSGLVSGRRRARPPT